MGTPRDVQPHEFVPSDMRLSPRMTCWFAVFPGDFCGQPRAAHYAVEPAAKTTAKSPVCGACGLGIDGQMVYLGSAPSVAYHPACLFAPDDGKLVRADDPESRAWWAKVVAINAEPAAPTCDCYAKHGEPGVVFEGGHIFDCPWLDEDFQPEPPALPSIGGRYDNDLAAAYADEPDAPSPVESEEQKWERCGQNMGWTWIGPLVAKALSDGQRPSFYSVLEMRDAIDKLTRERDAGERHIGAQSEILNNWSKRMTSLESALATNATEIAGLRARLDDATAYCSGEFPCEASTSAASLERERNNLLDQVSGLRGQIAEAEAMSEYVQHDYHCGTQTGERPCDCGFDAARAAATKEKQP